jgi:hypothetical protein
MIVAGGKRNTPRESISAPIIGSNITLCTPVFTTCFGSLFRPLSDRIVTTSTKVYTECVVFKVLCHSGNKIKISLRR